MVAGKQSLSFRFADSLSARQRYSFFIDKFQEMIEQEQINSLTSIWED